MRIRFIKPSILINEDLPELGPYAYVLFTGLWMYADRDGRFEWRPRKIKLAVMPAWDDVDAGGVEILLEKLCEKHFLHSYEVEGKRYAQVVNFKCHQKVDPREPASKIPPPPPSNGVSPEASDTSAKSVGKHRQDGVSALTERSGIWDLGSGSNTVPVHSGVGRGVQGGRGEPTPPVTPPREQTPRKPRSPVEPPGTITPPRQTPSSPPKPPPPPPPPPLPRKAPQRADRVHGMRQARECVPRGALDFWPHKPADVAHVRNALQQLGQLHGLPPPDDQIVRRVMDSARGAAGEDIGELLRVLHFRERFREIRSWGLLPLVVGQCYAVANSGPGANISHRQIAV